MTAKRAELLHAIELKICHCDGHIWLPANSKPTPQRAAIQERYGATAKSIMDLVDDYVTTLTADKLRQIENPDYRPKKYQGVTFIYDDIPSKRKG